MSFRIHAKIYVSLERKVKEAELKLCAYLCDYNLPFRLMDSLPKLCTEIFPDLEIARKIVMKRKKATQLCVKLMGPAAKDEVVRDLQYTKFSLIIDETTDISDKKTLAVIARYWKGNSVRDRFLDLLEVQSGTAAHLFDAIKSLLEKSNISLQNIIGFGADNASVMLGHLNGVHAKFKEIVPNIVVQGCACHSLHLCASNACKKLPSRIYQGCIHIFLT